MHVLKLNEQHPRSDVDGRLTGTGSTSEYETGTEMGVLRTGAITGARTGTRTGGMTGDTVGARTGTGIGVTTGTGTGMLMGVGRVPGPEVGGEAGAAPEIETFKFMKQKQVDEISKKHK
jgi:hypothetical protein